MTAFTTQKGADAETQTLARVLARLLRKTYGKEAEVEVPYHNGTQAQYGGGYCFTATISGEDFHIEVIGPYVEGDEDE